MVTDTTTGQSDDTTAFLRAARSGNLEKVVEYLDKSLDINTANSNGLNALHLASKDGHVEIVTELLKRGAKVDAATKKGNTALHIASLAGQSEIVNILIQYGAAVNIQSQNGFTPLYMAAQENHDQVVKLLLSNGANQTLATEDGFTPLAVAMQQGHDKVVSVLLENDSKGKVRLPALHIAAKKDDCKAADLLLQNDHKPDVTSKSGFTPLHIAAHYGNEEIGRLLIKKGADVNYLAKHNISPLHVAAKWGKNNMVKLLLENSSMIDAKTRDGLTPLHCAARSGHEEVVSTLLEQSAPISARTKNGLAPLHMASQGDHVEAARVLLYHRAPVDEVTIDYLTSLHVAAHCGHVRVAKLLLDRKADPNARALNGFTPLHIACKKNRIKVVELLLKHGASIESTTESGLTPLHVASFMGCMNIVIFLLQHEANPDVPTVRGETPLHLAARANQTDIIRILLRNGAKVDARAREEQTPLHIASRLGNVDIVMLLLQHGAAVDTTTKDMYTALHIAAKEGQEEVAAILVENKASVTATTKNGFTPLHIAAKYGNMNVAKILLQKDSKLDAQGKNNITPLHLACHYDHPEVATMILEKGGSPHLSSQNGHTPLHIAARKNQMEIASTLLEHGANPNTESKAGFTPLQLSAQKGHYDMTNLLIEHGANANHKSKSGLTALHMCAQEDFIRVASVLVKNNANVESETETGYRPIHVAAHFGNLSMIKFLLKHNAQIDVGTSHNYTPLHQAAQQGHAHIATALLEGNAKHNARTNDGLTALNIAQKLGYISVMEVLKGLKYDEQTPDNKYWEEKYKVIAPESIQESSFMSDSDDEGGSDALINEQPYRYLTVDLMKSLRDDSLPIDVTRDDPVHRPVTKVEIKEFTQSNNYCLAENFDSTDAINVGRLNIKSFLVSFLVDARGGAMKGCRHSGIKILIPPRRATMPIRITCRLIKSNKLTNPPVLMEGEALATRIIEMGPSGASFLGPVLIDVPHFAAIQGKDREIIILRSDNGENWKEHDNTHENDDALFNLAPDLQMNSIYLGRITRIITTEFPQYFAIITRIKQEVHVIGSDGGILISSVANHVQAVFPPGALTKKIKVGLQAHVIPAELTAKLLGNCVAVSPVITIEPRRRKFHKPITLTIPVPQAANKGMINNYAGETPTLRLLCSIAGGTSEAQWEDVTGSTPLTFLNDRVSFTTTVSARFWLMDCRNISEVPKMATELYKESLFVPFITNFIIYTKRMDILEATLRILCMTDGKETMHTLERQEEFLEIVKSRDVEALDGKDLYIEFSGNLVPVTKSGQQLKFTFKAFRQNRLSFNVKVRDPLLDPVARMMFMKDPKVAKGEAPQQPICVLNIVLPEEISSKTESDLRQKELDLNLITKMDIYKSTYMRDYGEKRDIPKPTSPHEKKIIIDILQNEQTDAESFDKKLACTLESVDASYPNDLSIQEAMSPELERQTYSEKRRFWEDITKKRDSYQLSESELSRASQITVNESDSEYLHSIVSEGEEMEAMPERSETLEDLNIPDISECTVAEKAHYFEEQIQKELSAASAKALTKITSQESFRERRKSSIDATQLLEEYPTSNDMKTTKIDLVVENKIEKIEGTSREMVWEQTKITEKIEITSDGKPTMIPRKIISEEKIITQVSKDIKTPVTAPRTLKPETSGESVKQEQENAVNEKKETEVLKSEINKIDFDKDKNISADFIASESKFSQEEISSVTEMMKKENLIEEKISNKSTLPEIKINKDNFNEDKNICSKFLESESNFSQEEITSVSEIKNKELIETKITNEPKVPSMIPVKTKAEHINKFDLKKEEISISKIETIDSTKKESKIPVPPVKIDSSILVEKILPHSPKEATKIPNLSEIKAEKVIYDLPKKEEKIATDSVSSAKETTDLKKEPFDSTKKDSKIPLFERESSDLSNKNLIKKETKIPESSTKAIDKSELKKEEVEIKTTSSITQDSSDTLKKKLDTSTVVLSPPATPVLKREPSDLSKKDSKIPVLKREASDLTKKESTSPKKVTGLKREPSDLFKKDSKIPSFKGETSDISDQTLQKEVKKITILSSEQIDNTVETKKEVMTEVKQEISLVKEEIMEVVKKETKVAVPTNLPEFKRESSDLSKKEISKIPVSKKEPSELLKKDANLPPLKQEIPDSSIEEIKVPAQNILPDLPKEKLPTATFAPQEIPGLKREPSDLSKKDSKIPVLKREPSDLTKKEPLTLSSPIAKEIPGIKREPSDLTKKDTKIPVMKREPSDLTKKQSTAPGVESPINVEMPGIKREPSDLSKKDSKIPVLKREPSDLIKKETTTPGSPVAKEVPGLRREPSDLSKQDTKIPLKREPSDLSKKKSSAPGSPIAKEIPGLKREPSDLSKQETKIPTLKREPSDLTKKKSTPGSPIAKEIPGLRREPSDLSKQDTKIPTLKREPSDLTKKKSSAPGSPIAKEIPGLRREPSDLSKQDTKIPTLKREPSDLSKKKSSTPGSPIARETPGIKREPSDLSKKDSKIPIFKREPSDLTKKDSASGASSPKEMPGLRREPSDLSKQDTKIPTLKQEPSDLSKKDSKIPAMKREGSDLSKKDSKIPTFKREPSDLTKKDSTKIQSPSGIQGPSLLKREPSDLTKKDSKIPSMKRETSDLSKKDSKIPTLKREPSDLSKKDSKIPSMKREGSDLSKKDSKIPVFKRESSDLSEKDLSKESKIPSRRESLTKTDKDKQAKPKLESKIPKMKFGESGPSKSLEKTGKNETSITATKITEKKSEHIETTMSEKKTQSQTITKTFTDPVEALKEFEEMERLFNAAPGVTTSKIDHEESKLLEKKEIISSEISRGDEKILKVQEKDQKLEEKKIESICKKETDDEVVEDKLSSQKISDKNQTQNISVLVSGDKQFINASASQSMNLAKDQERIQSRDNDDGIFVQETGSSTIKNKKIDMALSLEKDTPTVSGHKDIDMFDLGMSLRDELKTAVIGEQSHVESTERNETKMYPSRETSSQDYSQASETLEEHQQRVFEEHEARNIAENIVQQIEEEIVKRSESSDGLNHKLPESSTEKINDKIDNEPEDYDDQLADDLTEKFENLIGGKRKESQAQVIESVEQIRLSLLGNKDLSENSNRESSSISDDLTKDEESFPSSSLVESEKQDHPVKLKIELSRDSSAVELTKDKISPIRFEAYESTGARVLEIIEPKENARQDSIDVSSIEIDDPKHHREEDDEDDLSFSERHLRENDFGKLHESHAMNSLDKIGQDRDLTFSPSTMSDSSLAHDLRSLSPIIHSSKTLPEFVESDDAGFSSMEPDKTPEKLSHLDTKSIDKNIIPLIVSPKIKVAELEIKTDCDWTIGSEKIAINEFVEPSLAFDKELDDYHSSIIMQQSMSSSHDESATRSSEDISTIDSVKESDNYESASISTRVNIIPPPPPPPNEREIEHEMVEDKLDISCQELVATLQREYEAKTPTDEKIPVTPRKLSESDSELELVEQSLENVKKIKILPSSFDEKSSELTEMIFDSGINANIQNIIPAAVEETYEEAIKEKKEKEEKEIDTQEDLKNKLHLKDNELSGKKKYSEKNQNQLKNEISLKLKKEEIKNVDLSARYAITVLDEVVKKEINEIKESLEAAKQDLIEELSENSNTIFPIKESPSEFQFKLHPEIISNDLPFLYEAPSTLEHDHGQLSDSPIAKPRMIEKEQSKIQKDKFYDDKEQQEEEDEDEEEEEEMEEAQEEGYEEDEESEKSSKIIDHVPVPASRSGSDPDKDKESSSSLSVPPKPAPRRRQKPSRGVRKLNTDISEGGGSSSESSNYQSCDYDIGSGSRPSSSDIEALQSAAGLLSGTVSEYETALMSIEHSTASRPTSQDYQSAMSTLSSRESMKSLNSFSSGRLGSIDATSEHTDTLVASEAELDKDEIDENLELVLDDDNIPLDGSFEKSTDGLPRTMKRSSEMIFEQLSEDQDSSSVAGQFGGSTDDQSTKVTSSIIISEDDDLKTSTVDILSDGISGKIIDSSSSEIKIKPIEAQSTGDDIDASELKMTSLTIADDNETLLLTKRSVLQQASMSTSSTSGMSIETVIEREKLDRNSPDSDSFELVDKPDIIDDFVVIEEVGKEAEEFDSEGKSITIKNVPYASMKKYDKDLENLIVIKQNDDSQLIPTKLSRNNDLFDFESEESPPQVSNDEQYSQSLSDEELDHKKWMEMQFQEQRNYELEYDRGPLEDIKEEEMADFEAGSSRFGSLGSHKGSIGSSGSMKGSYGAEYDVLAGKKQFSRSIENDNISMNSLQEFENMEFAIVGDNCRKLPTCGSQDSVNNGGSLPRRYITSRSGHGDDVSVSSLKDFEGLEKACREAHIIEIRAKEEEDLLDHESPENRFRLENLTRPRIITNDTIITATSTITTTTMTTTTSITFNPGTSGSDDYEKRIMEIDEIIRIAQANVEKYDRQDDTTEDISQIEVTDIDKIEPPFNINLPLESDSDSLIKNRDVNAMETSTDSLEVDVDDEKKNLMCRSTDSLELKTTIDFPSLSYSDSLNNVKDGQTSGGQFNSERRISSDSLDMQAVDNSGHDENIHVKSSSSTEVAVKKNGKTIYTTTTDA